MPKESLLTSKFLRRHARGLAEKTAKMFWCLEAATCSDQGHGIIRLNEQTLCRFEADPFFPVQSFDLSIYGQAVPAFDAKDH